MISPRKEAPAHSSLEKREKVSDRENGREWPAWGRARDREEGQACLGSSLPGVKPAWGRARDREEGQACLGSS